MKKALQQLMDSFIHIEGDTKGNKIRTDILKHCPNVVEALNNARQTLWAEEKKPAIPLKVQTAMEAVAKVFPALAIAVFTSEQMWQYMDEDFQSFKFDDQIDVSILEDAMDSVIELPAIFERVEGFSNR